MNIEEFIGCCKLYSMVVVTKLYGRFFKKETNSVLLSMECALISSTALLEK